MRKRQEEANMSSSNPRSPISKKVPLIVHTFVFHLDAEHTLIVPTLHHVAFDSGST
jgi:hypothetical protein